MMVKSIIYPFALLLLFIKAPSLGQGINNIWYMGYQSWAGLPYGGIDVNFFSGAATINYVSRPMDFSRTHANISDTSGNMLFYTNGYYIADATNDTMMNGSNISPTTYSTAYPYGLSVLQACIILPKPGSNNLFYLIHSTLDNATNYNKAHYLYYSIVDINLNGGKGAVTSKNVILITDTLNAGKITACKHANGRDWWVICHRLNSNVYYKFLLSPSGISAPLTQAIGTVRSIDFGQTAFSNTGNKFAYFNAYFNTTATLDIYDFDRCSGDFSNPSIITIPQSSSLGGGIAFSPNCQYLYVSNIDSVYQYDVTSSNIANTKIVVAVWDSFSSPSPPLYTMFDAEELAPDGRIYITTGNSTFHMHVINQPDNLGVTCDLVQHGIVLPSFYFNTLPNHPNYFLGRIIGSPCDTVWSGITTPPTKEAPLKVFSNPNDGRFTLWFSVHDKPGVLEVYDINEKVVLKAAVAQWSQYKQVNITSSAAGIYYCRMSWSKSNASVKVIKE